MVRSIAQMTRKPKTAATPASAPTTRAVALPAGQYTVRTPVAGGKPRIDVLPAGLDAIAALAASGAPQAKAASALEMSLTTFKRLLSADDGEGPVKLAWERGRADLENEVAQYLLMSMRKGNVIAAIFFSKAQLGWSETPPVQNQVGIQIVLPDSSPDRESFARRMAERTAVTINDTPALAAPINDGGEQ